MASHCTLSRQQLRSMHCGAVALEPGSPVSAATGFFALRASKMKSDAYMNANRSFGQIQGQPRSEVGLGTADQGVELQEMALTTDCLAQTRTVDVDIRRVVLQRGGTKAPAKMLTICR